MKIFETERLVLRRFTPDDAPLILHLLNEPLFLRFIGDKNVRTLEDAAQYLRHGPLASYAKHGFGLFHVSLKADGTAIGMCGLLKRDTLEDVDVGFAYLPQFGGHGYATEAAQATLRHGRTVLGLKRIVAITAPGNTASMNVLKKIGLRHTATLRLAGYTTDSLLFTPAEA
ncbi:MAG: GNAT family N-acetyltransferase [Opitutae bacterium]|nr:GNAT family N-acetyltransferase [Opitutae bacterium]